MVNLLRAICYILSVVCEAAFALSIISRGAMNSSDLRESELSSEVDSSFEIGPDSEIDSNDEIGSNDRNNPSNEFELNNESEPNHESGSNNISQDHREQGRPCQKAGEAFAAFADTIAALRAPDGCPWDREQTHDSIAHNMIEEAYEAVDAIEKRDLKHLREELGDVLLQVVLQSQIAADAGEFDVADVCQDVNEKMIRRHPHVFGSAHASSANEVLDIWDKVKTGKRNAANESLLNNAANESLLDKEAKPEGLLDSVPVSFPALMQASKISRKAVSAGFEWDTVDDVWAKVEEEIAEFKQACAEGDLTSKELEFGDVLFTLVNVARKEKIDPETALRATCRKFRDRWAFMEGAAWALGKHIEDLSMDELQELWDQAKRG